LRSESQSRRKELILSKRVQLSLLHGRLERARGIDRRLKMTASRERGRRRRKKNSSQSLIGSKVLKCDSK